MNRDVIASLCARLPSPEEDVLPNNYQNSATENILGIEDPENIRFIYAYKDLRFGWNFVRTMARNKLPFVFPLEGRDRWLWPAYLHNCNPRRYRDPVILEALQFMHHTNCKERSVVNALLTSSDITMEKVAAKISRRLEVVEAYEALFHNVMDRREDHLFLSSIIYPEGRVVEMYDRYVVTETLDNLLIRAGYNNGANDVLFLSGFPSKLIEENSGKETATRLESLFMAIAIILARNGYINQSTQFGGAAINAARQLLSAAKASGQTETDSPFFTLSDGQTMLAEVTRVKRVDYEKRHNTPYDPDSARTSLKQLDVGK